MGCKARRVLMATANNGLLQFGRDNKYFNFKSLLYISWRRTLRKFTPRQTVGILIPQLRKAGSVVRKF